MLAKDVHLFSIKPAVQRVTWSFGANDRLFSQRYLITPNEDIGMAIRYYLKTARTDGATVVITDIHGKEVARLKGESAAGINTVVLEHAGAAGSRRNRTRRWTRSWSRLGSGIMGAAR